MKNQYTRYEDYLSTSQQMNNLKKIGVKYVFKMNKLKVCLGVGCLVVAILPNGLFIPMSFMGCYLLGINKTDLYLYKEKGLRLFKNKLRYAFK